MEGIYFKAMIFLQAITYIIGMLAMVFIVMALVITIISIFSALGYVMSERDHDVYSFFDWYEKMWRNFWRKILKQK